MLGRLLGCTRISTAAVVVKEGEEAEGVCYGGEEAGESLARLLQHHHHHHCHHHHNVPSTLL